MVQRQVKKEPQTESSCQRIMVDSGISPAAAPITGMRRHMGACGFPKHWGSTAHHEDGCMHVGQGGGTAVVPHRDVQHREWNM